MGNDGSGRSFGNAPFLDTALPHLSAPLTGLAIDGSTDGYWLVAADGGVFSYGDASFYGSMGGHHLSGPVVGMADTADGNGYWLVGADGGVFSYGDATFEGSLPSNGIVSSSRIVGMTVAN
jgi:hypothetical protein